jgi:hypothetical protein
MAKSNGGIIGPDNIPTGPLAPASGVWRLQDAFKYQSEGLWPVVTGITYPVANSLRFNSASTEYLQRTPASAGSLTTWTYSFWTKRSKLATAEQYLSAGPRSAPNVEDQIYSISTDAISWYDGTANSTVLRTSQLFRDVSAWYHLMFVWDTTNATAGNRARIYVNGTEVTAFSIDNNPSLNAVSKINGTGQHRIGQVGTVSGENLDGYLAEVVFIDGQALTPSSFGETDTVSGNWKPKDVSGLTFGTNGFYLQFQNSGALGTDSSGNGNTWTVNNLTSVDQMIDTPTNNFATLNPLFNTTGDPQLTEGNLSYDPSSAYGAVYSTFGVNTGKWYWEIYANSGGARIWNGIQIQTNNLNYLQNGQDLTGCVAISNNSNDLRIDGLSVGGSANWTTGDIVGFALDADAGTLDWTINGVSQTQVDFTSSIAWGYNHFITSFSSTNVIRNTYNFGQDSSFAGAVTRQNNQDSNGQGDFYYPVPSGYYALTSLNINFQG